MPKYLISGTYSPGSWTRMMHIADDRIMAGKQLIESLGGSVEAVYWMVSARTAFCIADLPDSHAASAMATVLTGTGAIQNVEMNEILTQEQLAAVLDLAENISQGYRKPGETALEGDSS